MNRVKSKISEIETAEIKECLYLMLGHTNLNVFDSYLYLFILLKMGPNFWTISENSGDT